MALILVVRASCSLPNLARYPFPI